MEMMDTPNINVLAVPEINTTWTKEVQTICQVYRRKILGLFKKVGCITGRMNKLGSDKKGS
eukprot:14141085-Ditylum_brightwellii.AAC.1